MSRPQRVRRIFVGAAATLVATLASSQSPPDEAWPDAEFQMARMVYATSGGGGSRGWMQPWWAIDYPEARIDVEAEAEEVTSDDVVARILGAVETP